MGPFKYKVIAIEGEYATIKRIDNETADTILIAVSYTHLTLPTNSRV